MLASGIVQRQILPALMGHARYQPQTLAAFADGDAMRNAYQLEVGEHDARPLAAVVQEHFHASALELVMQTIRGRSHCITAVVAHRCDRNAEGRHRRRPDDAALVVVLFDGSRDDAADSNAVTPHLDELRLAIDIEKRCAHRLRVKRAEREDVSDFDASDDFQHALAVGRGIARDHIANIRDHVGLATVATEIDAAEVIVGLVGATDEIAHQRDGSIDDQGHVGRDAHRA